MTTTVAYSTEYDPPCPVLALRVAAPQQPAGIAVVGLLDTGADLTLVPATLARTLDLPVVSRIRIAGVTGAVDHADVVAVTVELFGRILLAEAVAFGADTIVGRDVLNRLVLRLNGPRRILEVEDARASTPSSPRSRSRRRRGHAERSR